MLKRIGYLFALAVFWAGAAGAQTAAVFTNGVVSSASFLPASIPAGAISPGSIASIFGTNFATTTFSATTFPLPLSVNGVTVIFNGIAAPIFAITPTQINVQVPVEIVPGFATLVVTTPLGTTQPVTVLVQPFSPGIFTTAQNGQGPGAIVNLGTTTAINGFASSAAPGQSIALFGTGFGTASTALGTGIAGNGQSLTQTVTATVGGVPAQVTFAGLAPTFVGLDQINVIIPQSVALGCFVPVQLTINGQVSNTVTVAVAGSSSCSGVLTGAVVSPTTTIQSATLSQNSIIGATPTTTTNVSATFATTQGNVVTTAGLPPVGGGCTVSVFAASTPPTPTFTTLNFLNTTAMQPLNVGTLTVTGTAVPQTTLIPTPFGTFGQTITTSPITGTAILSGTGSPQTAPFGPLSLTVASPLGAPNFSVTNSSFSQAVPFNVTFACPTTDPNAQVGVIIRSFDPVTGAAGVAQCNTTCLNNSFTVPASVLAQLPASGTTQASVQLVFIPGSSQTLTGSGVSFNTISTTTLGGLTLIP